MRVPMHAVVDYALGRPEVARERLAVYGYSGGGGLCLRPPCMTADQGDYHACLRRGRPAFVRHHAGRQGDN